MSTKLIFLIDSWHSAGGGIQTVNRELCLALAALQRASADDPIEIICIAKEIDEKEQIQALAPGLRLLRPERIESDASDRRVITEMFHSIFLQLPNVACVVGHSKFTGKAARAVRDKYFSAAKVVTIYHMDPDETEVFKDGEPQSEDRSNLERDVAYGADLAFAIGPRLGRSLVRILAGQKNPPHVYTLLCGMRSDIPPRQDHPRSPAFLFLGRVEHPKVKGVDLFAKAAGRLIKRMIEQRRLDSESAPTFVIRGFPQDASDAARIFSDIRREAEQEAGHAVNIIRRTYTSDPATIDSDILGASALVMPSGAEGFGLVALEAISHGVPTIVSKFSGVGEVLQSQLEPGTEAHYIVDTLGLGADAVEPLVNAMDYFIQRPERFNLVGQHLRERLAKNCTWVSAARTFLQSAVGEDLIPTEMEGDVPNEIKTLLEKELEYVNRECIRSCGRALESVFIEPGLSKVHYDDLKKGLSFDILDGAARAVRPDERQTWTQISSDEGVIVLLGPPGAGKTVFLLREVEQRCLGKLNATNRDQKKQIAAFYIHSNEIAAKTGTTRSLFDAVLEIIAKRHGDLSGPCQRTLRAAFQSGELLLAIDALDEIGGVPTERAASRRHLIEQLASVGRLAGPCRLVLSSRIAGYSLASIPGATEWQLLPFTPSQWRQVVQKWLADRPEDASSIITRIASTPPLSELLTNPLLLSLACRLWSAAIDENRPLPTFNSRSDLYRAYAARLHARWIERTSLKGYPPTVSQQEAFRGFVGHFAWQLRQKNYPLFTFAGSELVSIIEQTPQADVLKQRDLLDDLCEAGIIAKAGLLDQTSPYLFLHKTLLDYFSAEHLVSKSGLVNEAIRPYFDDPSASTLLWMVAGLLKNPQEFLETLVQWAHRQLSSYPREQVLLQSPAIGDRLADCFFESGSANLPERIRHDAWDIMTRALDRIQRRRRQRGGEWAELVNWSFVFRAMQAAALHEGPESRATLIIDLIRQFQNPQQGGVVAIVDYERLRVGLLSDCSVVRWSAIWLGTALVAKGAHSLRTPLLAHVQNAIRDDPNSSVRSIATRSMAAMSGHEADGTLRALLTGADLSVAGAAAIALGRLPSINNIESLKRQAESLIADASKAEAIPLLISVLGAIDSAADKLTELEGATVYPISTLAEVLIQVLGHAATLASGTAASALGKMKWAPAWEHLRRIVENKSDDAANTQVMRASASFACDQLAGVIDEALLQEAAMLFAHTVVDTSEPLGVRRPSASGAARLIQRGCRSRELTNVLLETTRDLDPVIARSSFFALLRLAPTDILEDLKLIVSVLGSSQRQLLSLAVGSQPTETGLQLALWLLENDRNVRVLASTMSNLAQICKAAMGGEAPELRKSLSDTRLVERLLNCCIQLSSHDAPNLKAAAINLWGQLTRLPPLQREGKFYDMRQRVLTLARDEIQSQNEIVVATATGILAFLGTQEDLPKLEALMASKYRKVRDSAKGAHEILKRKTSSSSSSVVPAKRT